MGTFSTHLQYLPSSHLKFQQSAPLLLIFNESPSKDLPSWCGTIGRLKDLVLYHYWHVGSGCSTEVEHTAAEQNSWGCEFNSRRVLGFFSSLSIPQECVLNLVSQQGATPLIFHKKDPWLYSLGQDKYNIGKTSRWRSESSLAAVKHFCNEDSTCSFVDGVLVSSLDTQWWLNNIVLLSSV